MTETKALNDVNNMNNNIELVKEKMRVDQSDNEEHIKTIKSHTLELERLHNGLLDQRQALSNQVKSETSELREQIIGLKAYFDEQKDVVIKNDEIVKTLQKQIKQQKRITTDELTSLKDKFERI